MAFLIKFMFTKQGTQEIRQNVAPEMGDTFKEVITPISERSLHRKKSQLIANYLGAFYN